MIATYADGFRIAFRVRRRWFPWGTDNVTIGATIFARHLPLNAPTMRHELTHVRQYRDTGTLRFLWRYLTNRLFRGRMEYWAHLAEQSVYPTWA